MDGDALRTCVIMAACKYAVPGTHRAGHGEQQTTATQCNYSILIGCCRHDPSQNPVRGG